MATLFDTLQTIELLFASMREAGGEAFRRVAASVLELAALSDADAALAMARIQYLERQLPIRLTSNDDVLRAKQLCLGAALRLRAAAREVINDWPAPMAHEVRQLAAMLDGTGRGGEPTPEGALIQLRDTTEALMKVPASVLAAWVLAQGGEAAAAIRKLVAEVSGGGWNTVAREAASRVLIAAPDGPLAPLARLFAKRNPYRLAMDTLWEARNEYLGHGALRPNPADTAELVAWFVAPEPGHHPPPSVKHSVATLAAGLAAAAAEAPWAGLRLEAVDGDTVIDLTGAAALDRWSSDPRHHHHEGRMLDVRLVADGLVLPLGPLVAARICTECERRDLFIFDSAKRGKQWPKYFHDYAKGHRNRVSAKQQPELQAAFEVIGEAAIPPRPAQRLRDHAAMLHLDALRIDRLYRSPALLRRPLAAFIAAHDRGLFWLQAPAHVGKTTFAQALAGILPDDPVAPPRFDDDRPIGSGSGVVGYFCKQEFRENRESFMKALCTQLPAALGIPQRDRERFPEVSEVLDAEQPALALATWLERWRALANQPEGRLLLLVDGLDEADSPASADSILGLLPAAKDLTAGLYVLLTSRPIDPAVTRSTDRAPVWLAPVITKLLAAGPAQAWPVKLDDADYVALLGDYAKAALRERATPELVADLVVQADHRFSLFSLLVGQLSSLPPAEVAKLGTKDTVYDRFLGGLEPRFGPKLADDLLAVLAVLAAAQMAHAWTRSEAARVPDPVTGKPVALEPLPELWPGLTLEVLAEAAGLDEPADAAGRRYGVALVEALLLLRGALLVWRAADGTARYRLGLSELADRLAGQPPWGAAVQRAEARLAGLCLDAVVDTLEPEWRSDAEPDAEAERLLREVFPLLPGLVALAGSDTVQRRYANEPVADVGLWVEARHGERVAASARQVAWYDAVLAARYHGAGPADGDATRINDLAGAYMNRGVAKQSAPGFGPGAAIADYDRAITLREALQATLGEEWPVPWRNDLANAYMNRGVAKESAPGFGPGAAIADYDRAITLMEALQATLGEQWPVPWRNDLAGAYMNRGTAKQSAPGFGPGAAIADYDRAITLREALQATLGEQWPVPWRNDLAGAYVNRGAAKRSAPGFGPGAAIADYDRAITLREALQATLGQEWPVPWRNDLAAAYMNRGNAKQSAPGFGPSAAIADYDRAITLREALQATLGEEWPVPWRNDLANAYMNRGNAKQSAPGFGPGAAIADYDRAITLREALQATLGEQWPVPWRNDLAGAYMNRGNAKQSAPGFGPGAAIADYDRAITLMEALQATLGEEWPVPWRNDLANAYMNRGNAKQSAPGFGPGAAIADYDRAITLREALQATLGEHWPVPWRNGLAGAYMGRGNAKQSAPGFGPGAAIADYDRAVTLREALQATLGEDWPVPWRNDLAAAYMNRGNAKQDAPGFGPGAAIADYDRAVTLREALQATLGEDWPVPWRNDLAAAYMNRGNAKQDAPGFGPGAAIADYDRAITLMEALQATLGEDWPVPWRNDLAGAYMNRGNAKRSAPGFGPGAAIADYDRAITLMEALQATLGEHWPVPWRNGLAGAYVNRGVAKQDAPGFGPGAAIADYDRAITLMEALQATLGDDWPVPWRNDLAAAYMNRGNAKQSAPGFGPGAAIADHDRAITLREALQATLGEDWPVPWRNDLAAAYMGRGNAKRSATGFGPGAAIADHDRAITLREALQATLGQEWPVPWRNDLAAAYMNRGNAKQSAPGFGPSAAIADYDRAIKLMEALQATLGEDWPVPWYDDLATAYLNRANARQAVQGHPAALVIADLAKAIRLWQAMQDSLGDQWPEDLAEWLARTQQRLRQLQDHL